MSKGQSSTSSTSSSIEIEALDEDDEQASAQALLTAALQSSKQSAFATPQCTSTNMNLNQQQQAMINNASQVVDGTMVNAFNEIITRLNKQNNDIEQLQKNMFQIQQQILLQTYNTQQPSIATTPASSGKQMSPPVPPAVTSQPTTQQIQANLAQLISTAEQSKMSIPTVTTPSARPTNTQSNFMLPSDDDDLEAKSYGLPLSMAARYVIDSKRSVTRFIRAISRRLFPEFFGSSASGIPRQYNVSGRHGKQKLDTVRYAIIIRITNRFWANTLDFPYANVPEPIIRRAVDGLLRCKDNRRSLPLHLQEAWDKLYPHDAEEKKL